MAYVVVFWGGWVGLLARFGRGWAAGVVPGSSLGGGVGELCAVGGVGLNVPGNICVGLIRGLRPVMVFSTILVKLLTDGVGTVTRGADFLVGLFLYLVVCNLFLRIGLARLGGDFGGIGFALANLVVGFV